MEKLATKARPHAGDGHAADPGENYPHHGDEDRDAALHDRLAASEKALLETREALLRALADQENARKLAARERDDALRYGAAQLARDLLDSLDNLQRAIDSAPRGEDAGGLLAGVIATQRNLRTALAKHGIRQFDPLGERFDPAFHEAVHRRPDPAFNTGDVIEVSQPGYVIHDRLLRPAKVAVADNEGVGPSID